MYFQRHIYLVTVAGSLHLLVWLVFAVEAGLVATATGLVKYKKEKRK